MTPAPHGSREPATTRDDRDALQRIGEALAGRYTKIGLEIARRAADEIPGYGDAAPELISDLPAGAAATVELFTRTLANA